MRKAEIDLDWLEELFKDEDEEYQYLIKNNSKVPDSLVEKIMTLKLVISHCTPIENKQETK